MHQDNDSEELLRAALEVTRHWPSSKAEMAIEAAGLVRSDGPRKSLEFIAAERGGSRETVRRARNELVEALNLHSDDFIRQLALAHTSSIAPAPDGRAAAGRALRRLLTLTGPLVWDEVLIAWARAGGRAPHLPLPDDLASLRRWIDEAGGLSLTSGSVDSPRTMIRVSTPEPLDRVSQFLLDLLGGRQGGVDRSVLLESAQSAGLKAATIATTLSHHPAVMRLGRGTWALRGQHAISAPGANTAVSRPKALRARPTAFTWDTEGLLIIEFSLPRGPSPVIAVPQAIADLVEGRKFRLDHTNKTTHVSVSSARMWGFGSLSADCGLARGQRVKMALNLVTGSARLSPLYEGGLVDAAESA